jgi:hypothetical protein
MESRNGRYSAPVQVFGPCACASCRAGYRWILCLRMDARLIATFDCAPWDARLAASVPHPVAVAELERRYPDAFLLYVDPSSVRFDRELAEERARRPVKRVLETAPPSPSGSFIAMRIVERVMHH